MITNTNNRPGLKDIYKDIFAIGIALDADQIAERDPKVTVLIEKHFNSISPENALKWDAVHPEPDRFDFEQADRFVAFGEDRGMHIVGHTLVWYRQTPQWVFLDEKGNPLGREALLQRMKDHIVTVMGRYKGRVHGWDVVNEAIVPDGGFGKSKWLEIIGEDYVLKAFEYARQADPDAELYYNDYNMWQPLQYEGVVRLLKNLRSNGVRIDGVGTQVHWGLDYPHQDQIETFINALAELEVKLMVTEMDVTVLPYDEKYVDMDLSSLAPDLQKKMNPYADGLPEQVSLKQADTYADFFSMFLKHRDKFKRVTFWGLHDGQSWRSNWPIIGRTDYPMLFDREYRPKPALDAISNLMKKMNLQ